MRNKKEFISTLCRSDLAIKQRENGITLIALVVTIVVLLILAGITIASFTGDEGIFNETKEIANSIEDLQNKTIDDLHQIANELSSSAGDALNPGEPENPDNPGDSTVDNIVDKVQDDTVIVKDENDNKITIPGGFRVLSHGTKNSDIDEVVYNYSPNHKPCVQDGIVIADAEDNQFVWIPVGEIKNKENTTTKITLGRYTFDTTNGTPSLVQNADNYATITNLRPSGYSHDFQELTENSGNTSAKNLKDFVTKTKANGGYYLARYEASGGTGNKTGSVKSQFDKPVWGDITQPMAATNARNMYNGDSYVESDLINSYSWDTAIVYIQKYSGSGNYANQKSANKSTVGKLNAGKSGDKVCNIYDMASNCLEFTTEHSEGVPNNPRGNSSMSGDEYKYDGNGTTAYRWWTFPDSAYVNHSFRPILYLK